MKNNELKVGAILSYIILGIELIIGLVYTPILTRILGQSEYGLYSLVASVISYLTILDLGLGSAIVVFTSRYKAKNDKDGEQKLHAMFLCVYILIGIITGIIGYVLYLNVYKLFGNTMSLQEIEKAKILMLILMGNLVISFPMSIFGSIIIAYEKFIFDKIKNLIILILKPLIMIPILLLGYKSIALALVTTILNISILVINMIYCLKKLNIKMKFTKFNFKLLAQVFSFSFFIFLNVIVDKVNWSVDQFILGSVVGTISVAIYSIATQINTIYLSFSTAISSLLLPKATQMETKSATDQAFTELFIRMGRIQYTIMGLIITGFVLVGKEFMILWQGKEYIQSYYIACILMIPVTVPLIQNTGLSILQAKNMHKFRTVIFIFIAIINVCISIPLAKQYGGIGTSIGTAISLVMGQIIIMNIYYYKKIHIDIPKFWKEILKMTIPVLVAFIIGIGINKVIIANNYGFLLIKIIIYSIIYMLLIWKFGINDYEKQLLKGTFQKIKNKLKGEVNDKNNK